MFNEAFLRITQRLAKVGGWAVNFGEKNDVFWTPGTFEILEYPRDKPPSYADAMSCIQRACVAPQKNWLGLGSVFGFARQSNGHVSSYSERVSGTTP